MRAQYHRVSMLVALALVCSFAFAAVLLAAPSRAAIAGQAPWSTYTSVIGGTGTLANYSPDVVADTAGNIYVFYYRVDPGGVFNLYVMKYEDEGTAGALSAVAGFPVRVNSVLNNVYAVSGDTVWNPKAAITSDGTVYVTWFTTAISVFVSKSVDGGMTWSGQVQVNPASLAGISFAPAIAVAPNGRVYVAWAIEKTSWYNVSVAYSTDGGATFSPGQNVSLTGRTGWTGTPSLAVDSHNRAHLVFTQYTGSGFTPSWINYTYSDDGVTWSTPVTLNSGSLEGWNPQIAVDSQGNLLVAWVDARTSTSGNPLVYYTTSADHGVTWSPDLPISQGLASPVTGYWTALVRIAVEGDKVLVAWDASFIGTGVMSTVLSMNGGATWASEQIHFTGGKAASLAADGNGTFYGFSTDLGTTPISVGVTWWHSPPSTVKITSVVAGTGSLAVRWTAPPENDVESYLVFRSNDGSTYNVVATVGASSTAYTDNGLANGTYWYQVEAVDAYGYTGQPSASGMGTVGPTAAQLQDEITSLQRALNSANANLASIQTQLDALKGQVSSLQGNTSALQNQLNGLQTQLNNMQTASYANLAFEIILVVLVAVVLLNQLRKPKSPQMMMAQPGQMQPPASPKQPEDDL